MFAYGEGFDTFWRTYNRRNFSGVNVIVNADITVQLKGLQPINYAGPVVGGFYNSNIQVADLPYETSWHVGNFPD